MNKLDLSVIILTYNEELHIRRALNNVCPIAKTVYVIDSPSTDNTVSICREFSNVQIIEHRYPENQADQFNWAIDNIGIETEWVLRLDADEYLTPGLIDELYDVLPSLQDNVSACVIPIGRAFGGRILKHGIVNSVSMIRLFRKDKARYEKRMMDEHLRVISGDTYTLKHKLIDDNRLPIGRFIEKHNSYSTKEAIILLDEEYGFSRRDEMSLQNEYFAGEVISKRKQKNKYAKLPLFHRAFWYFIYRYIFKLGFLDGKEGFEWDFFQGLWYRMLVDAKIYEIKRSCENDAEKIREFIEKNYDYRF